MLYEKTDLIVTHVMQNQYYRRLKITKKSLLF